MDFGALHDSVHNTYNRWGRGAQDIDIKYLDERRRGIEKAKAKYFNTRGASVKAKPEASKPAGSTAAPSAPQRQLPADQHAAALRQKYGKKSSSGDKLVASGPTKPSTPAPVWSSSTKGNNQPDLSRSRSLYGTSPYHAPGASLGGSSSGSSAPARPSMRQVWDEGVANIQARRVEQDTRMAQNGPGRVSQFLFHKTGSSSTANPAPMTGRPVAPMPRPAGSVPLGRFGQALAGAVDRVEHMRSQQAWTEQNRSSSSSGGWLARTGQALQARADQIGTERAVRNRSFSEGASSHSTGHGRRMF